MPERKQFRDIHHVGNYTKYHSCPSLIRQTTTSPKRAKANNIVWQVRRRAASHLLSLSTIDHNHAPRHAHSPCIHHPTATIVSLIGVSTRQLQCGNTAVNMGMTRGFLAGKSSYVSRLRRAFLLQVHPDRFRSHSEIVRKQQANLVQGSCRYESYDII